MNIEQADTFGNYLIHGIDEIILPQPVSWWPDAPGWKVLGVMLVLWLLIQAARRGRHWWRNRYRREALRRVTEVQKQAGGQWHEVTAVLPYYLKATALHAYPRAAVASLSGETWARFLDAHYTGPPFCSDAGRKLLSVAYLPSAEWQLNEAEAEQLLEMARLWIATHRETADV